MESYGAARFTLAFVLFSLSPRPPCYFFLLSLLGNINGGTMNTGEDLGIGSNDLDITCSKMSQMFNSIIFMIIKEIYK